MKCRTRSVRYLSPIWYLAGCVLAASLALGSWSSWAADEPRRPRPADGAKVLEPGIKHFGKSYNELAGDWYNWAVQFPLATNPIVEDGEIDCTRGQAGHIWFLAGNFGGFAGEPNPSKRTCTIPGGKALFFPLANNLFWVPEDGADVNAVRRKANDATNTISGLRISIDDVAIADPFAYRAQSPPGGFALRFGPLLADFGSDPQPDPRDPAVADGYWILLAPLRKGEHKIHFRASDGATFNLEVTYHLTVD
jgi:hypothetical protein